MQQRYYDPGIGRFLSVGPVTVNSGTGANFNRYWYANNNPYKFTDPDGRYGFDRNTRNFKIPGNSFADLERESQAAFGGGALGRGLGARRQLMHRSNLRPSKQIGQQDQVDAVVAKYGINTHGADVEYDPGLSGADAWTQSENLVYIGPGAFRFGTQSYLGAVVGHEISHVIQYIQRRASTTRNGAAANEAEAYKVNIKYFGRFKNTPAEQEVFENQFHNYYDGLPQNYKDRVDTEAAGAY